MSSPFPLACPKVVSIGGFRPKGGSEWCLIAAEAAIFTIFVAAYIFYIGKSITGPQPKDVLPVRLHTVCLLASSLTIHNALRRITAGKMWAFAHRVVAADNPPGRHFPVQDCL